MDILHGTWIPPQASSFDNLGQFVVWVETSKQQKVPRDKLLHPQHLFAVKQLEEVFTKGFQFKAALHLLLSPEITELHAILPSFDNTPLPSLEMAQITGQIITDEPQWQCWKVKGISVQSPLLFLKEIRFFALQTENTFRLGQDLQFWIQYAQQLRNLLGKHQYLPVMKAYQSVMKSSTRKNTTAQNKSSNIAFEAGWEPVSYAYETGLQDYSQAMPFSCRSLYLESPSKPTKTKINFWEADNLLRHFSEQQLDLLVRATPVTQKLGKVLTEVWISNALDKQRYEYKAVLNDTHWRQWSYWQQSILGHDQHNSLVLGLRLLEVSEENKRKNKENSDDSWAIVFFAESRQDPSLQLTLEEIWGLSKAKRTTYESFLGSHFEKELLLALGQAARISPLLWDGLETSEPVGVQLSLEAAYDFLKNDAEILEAAGFKISVPAWWTPKGRQRARIRIKASGASNSSQAPAKEGDGYFNMTSLVKYEYELAVGDKALSEAEWNMLVNAKSPLVQFRGEWMELDSKQMSELLELWQQQQSDDENISLIDMLKHSAESSIEEREFVFDDVLASVLTRLQDRQSMSTLDSPLGLQGELREYQKQGLSWLAYQEALGLHPCLADDMGLGKTIQVISLLLQERQQQAQEGGQSNQEIGTTLLVAPTSVLGNWEKEIDRFAPELSCVIHHGNLRETKAKAFRNVLDECDVLITSFTLMRKDKALFNPIHWHRVVIDEAQNIKNPKSAQTKAIQSLNASRRIAMTGTPIENRLMDVWSIFHFLNPGYLGTAAQFKRGYETPIQRDGNTFLSEQLRKLIHPFILRRLKTDDNIIGDLPDKIEQKVYCNLTQEQASLYQAVVDDVQKQLEKSDGIQRKGLMLATLMKLKQICNHPAQFLQDNSEFSQTRSHKLARINEMIEEALEEGDSLLLFTQFTEIGTALEKQLRERYRCPVYYLHGGTSRKRREVMIDNFQNKNTPAGIFILSLKAGGVGITLTRANHVFHFDRWWNPAVENQATDRAYRIGQEKTVFAHKMVTIGTLEERIDQMLEDKQKLADSIVGSDEAWLTEMDNAAFNELIQLNRSTILD